MYVLCRPLVCGMSPSRLASLANKFPSSVSLTCCGYSTFASFTKAVFGAPFGQQDAFASGISSIAVLELKRSHCKHNCLADVAVDEQSMFMSPDLSVPSNSHVSSVTDPSLINLVPVLPDPSLRSI